MHFHQKTGGVAPLSASETVEEPTVGGNLEGGCVFLVKRTQALEPGSCPFQADIRSDEFDQVGSVEYVPDEVIGDTS